MESTPIPTFKIVELHEIPWATNDLFSKARGFNLTNSHMYRLGHYHDKGDGDIVAYPSVSDSLPSLEFLKGSCTVDYELFMNNLNVGVYQRGVHEIITIEEMKGMKVRIGFTRYSSRENETDTLPGNILDFLPPEVEEATFEISQAFDGNYQVQLIPSQSQTTTFSDEQAKKIVTDAFSKTQYILDTIVFSQPDLTQIPFADDDMVDKVYESTIDPEKPDTEKPDDRIFLVGPRPILSVNEAVDFFQNEIKKHEDKLREATKSSDTDYENRMIEMYIRSVQDLYTY